MHNRHKGSIEFATVDLVFECEDCETQERFMILTNEEQSKAEKWQDAIDRMTFGRARPENTDAPETVPVKDILNANTEVYTDDPTKEQTPDMSNRVPDGQNSKLDDILEGNDSSLLSEDDSSE